MEMFLLEENKEMSDMGFLGWAANNVKDYFDREEEKKKYNPPGGMNNAPGTADIKKVPPKDISGNKK